MVVTKNFEIKSIQSDTVSGSFSGILSTYGNIDSVGDVCEPGCFDRSISEKGDRFPLLWNHSSDEPIGSFVITDTKDELAIEGSCNMEVQRGKEAFHLLKRGDVTGLSIGYATKKATYDVDGIRHLVDVDLWEGSITPFPANPRAGAQAKSMIARKQAVIRARFSRSLALKRKLCKEDRDSLLALLDKAFEDEEDTDTDEEDPTDRDADSKEPMIGEEDPETVTDEPDEVPKDGGKSIITIEVKRLIEDNVKTLRELNRELKA